MLSVTVWDHPELTIPAGEFRSPESTGHPVTSDGKMFYPHVGTIAVGGKTLPEVREELTQRLTRVIQNPQLDVRVASFRGKKVQVTGEVMGPAALPINDVPMRALDAITFAKGFTPEADMQNVILTRAGKTYRLDLQAVNERGQVGNNWLLQDGDVLHVTDRRENRVFVLGEVKKPAPDGPRPALARRRARRRRGRRPDQLEPGEDLRDPRRVREAASTGSTPRAPTRCCSRCSSSSSRTTSST